MNEMISYKNVIRHERLMNAKLSLLAVSCGDDYHVCMNRMVKLLHLSGFSLNDNNLNDMLYKFNYTPTTHLYALTFTGVLQSYVNINNITSRGDEISIIDDIDDYPTDASYDIPCKNDYFLVVISVLTTMAVFILFLVPALWMKAVMYIPIMFFMLFQILNGSTIKGNPALNYLGIKGTYDKEIRYRNNKLKDDIKRVNEVFEIIVDSDDYTLSVFQQFSLSMSSWNNKKRIVYENYHSRNIGYDNSSNS